MKKNKICEKGISCGGTCIERSDKCWHELNPTSIAIAERLSELRNGGYLKKIKETENKTSINLSFDDNQSASIIFSPSIFKGYTQIDFYMNNATDANAAEVPNHMKIKMAKAVKKEINVALSKYKDGTKFVAIPNYSDGKRESRIKAYKNAGFGDMSESTEHMSAILLNGRLQPGDMIEF